ncbi:MAG: nickel-dependent hydrogenase large subunit [Trueperaceae bacterium]|nr:nickel-dependent hydrogenase large subunit [Trueperaceae bacterium]
MAAKHVIDPITRIEGHLRIEIEVGDAGTVEEAASSSTAFRGFESIMRGRDPKDVGLFAQRICGVCTYHHYERGVEATESAYGVTIPPNARMLRNLIWAAQLVNDHTTHFYQLHSMDWFDVVSALDADPQAATDVAMQYHDKPYNASVSHYRAVAERLLAFVQSGQLGPFAGGYWGHPKYRLTPEENLIVASHYLDNLAIQRLSAKASAIFGGKNPHPQSLIVGGITSARDALDAHRIAEYQFLMAKAADFVERAYLPDMALIGDRYREEALAGEGGGLRNYMSFGAISLDERPWENRAFFLQPGLIVDRDLDTVRTIDPMLIGEEVAHSWYTYEGGEDSLHPLDGQTNPAYTGFADDNTLQTEGSYSWIKSPRYDGMPVEVGPLARMLIAYAGGNESVRTIMDDYTSQLGVPFEFWYSTVGRTVARGLETKIVSDYVPSMIGNLTANVSNGDDRFFNRYDAKDGPGWAMAEAPRGSLSHWLTVQGGSVSNYQAVVPSTWNASPKDGREQRGAYESALVGQPMADPTQPLEVVRTIHSFDPCLACAVHILNRDGEEIAHHEVEV